MVAKSRKALSVETIASIASSVSVIVGLLSVSMQVADYTHTFSIFDNQYEEFDFVVVGGGSAGSAVASRLSEDPTVSVLLIEAGGNPNPVTLIPAAQPYMGHSSIMFDYATVPQKGCAFGMLNQSVLWPRGRGLGGSSNINFMTYNRGHPYDFDRWADITGDNRWGFKNVLKYFLKQEDYYGFWDDGKGNDGYHNKGGPLRIERIRYTRGIPAILKSAQEMGYRLRDANAIQTPGFSPIDFTQESGTRFSTYRAYIQPTEHRPNFKIYRYSQATKIDFDSSSGTLRAVGVTYYRHGVKRYAAAKKEIILSTGAIASPQLLMLSGIGPKNHLSELGIPTLVDLPVGENLQDHVVTVVGPFLLNKKVSFIAERDLTLDAIAGYFQDGSGPLSSDLGVSVFGMTSTRNSPDPVWPDLLWSVHTQGIQNNLGETLDTAFNTRNNLFEEYLSSYTGRDAHFMVQVLGLPRSVGYLRLNDTNPNTFPIINPKYYSDPGDLDMQTMIDGIEEFVNLYENSTTLGLKLGAKLLPENLPGCENFVHRTRAYWECVVRTITGTLYHPAGTCSMGKPGEPGTVVDSNLKVLGVEGLRVADSGIMPKVTK